MPNQKCEHRRIKKNYPFGHGSGPFMFCKDCGKIIKPHDLMKPKTSTHKVKESRPKKK